VPYLTGSGRHDGEPGNMAPLDEGRSDADILNGSLAQGTESEDPSAGPEPTSSTAEAEPSVVTPEQEPVPRSESFRPRHVWLALIALGGLGVRIGYVFLYRRHAVPSGDAFFYHYQANLLVAGKGFINPYSYLFFHHSVPSADHPPLWTLVLAVGSLLGLKSFFAQILWGCLIGALAIWLIGLAATQVAGPRAGVIAAVIAALYPVFWINDGSEMAETLATVLIALIIWAFFRLWRRPSLWSAAWLGLFSALAALTRSEMAILIPVFVIGAGLASRGVRLWRRLALSAVAAVVVVATFVPWWAYTFPRFTDTVLLSNEFGVTLATANCNTTYSGEYLGYWSLPCATRIHTDPHADASVQDHEYRAAALRYVKHHESRLPAVMAARVGRELGLYRPAQQIDLEWSVLGRPRLPAAIGLGVYYVVAVLAVGGAVVLRRRRIVIFPFVAILVETVLIAMVTFGQTRYRTSLDTAIVILAGVAVDHLPRLVERGRGPRSPHDPHDRTHRRFANVRRVRPPLGDT
jgi:4-amino-4-deoxy-L-arabinose transferase-like glycosyltransferase